MIFLVRMPLTIQCVFFRNCSTGEQEKPDELLYWRKFMIDCAVAGCIMCLIATTTLRLLASNRMISKNTK